MMKPEAVIFDMDGVLIDSEPIHCEIERKIFDKLGVVVTEALHRSYMGASGDFMYADLKSRFGLSATVEELVEMDDLFRCDYIKLLTGIHPNDGVISLLREIKMAGLKLAVATSSSPQIVDILLNRCQIAPFFDAIVTTSEAGNSKPSPDVYLLAAQKIGVAPASCIVFEDSPNGLLAAKKAGMYCVAVQTGSISEHELSKRDYLIQSFNEITLPKLIEIFSINQIMDESIQ